MNEREDLERQLDAAFASTRPRRGFEDELWARLQARRPWWRRLSLRSAASWQAVAAGVTVLVVGLGALGISRLSHVGPGGAMGTTGGAAFSGAGDRAAAPRADGRYGALPRPPDTPGAAAISAAAGQASAPAPAQVSPGATMPPEPISLPVYRYAAGSGPAPGTIVEADRLPPGLDSAPYPTRSPVQAVRDAASAGGQPAMVVTGVRLVYVAVADVGQTYLEPVYLVTGVVGSDRAGQARQVLVSALSPSSIR